MESKGIIRRIDELGRIVIPREYRKLHGIELGDPMEICAFDDGVIKLKKVDTGADLVKSAGKVLRRLAEILNCTALLTDGKIYIDGYGKTRGEFIGQKVENSISTALKNRAKTTLSASQTTLCRSDERAIIRPIHRSGDLYGGIVAIVTGADADETVVDFCAEVICEYAQTY